MILPLVAAEPVVGFGVTLEVTLKALRGYKGGNPFGENLIFNSTSFYIISFIQYIFCCLFSDKNVRVLLLGIRYLYLYL